MQKFTDTTVSVEATIHAPIAKTWNCWNQPEHLTKWCFASPDWEVPFAENDLRTGGKFKTRMAAKDGSMGFDFEGIYSTVNPFKLIEYYLEDGRKISIEFTDLGSQTRILEVFEIEHENPEEMQRGGWQAILDNFKKYAENLG